MVKSANFSAYNAKITTIAICFNRGCYELSQNVTVKGHRINKYGILGPRKIVRFTAEVECSETNNVNENLLAYFVHYKTELKRKLK